LFFEIQTLIEGLDALPPNSSFLVVAMEKRTVAFRISLNPHVFCDGKKKHYSSFFF